MQGNYSAWGNDNQFWAYVDNNGYVVATDYTGAKRIGVTVGKYKEIETALSEALDKAEKYYKQLEDAGLVKKELSADEKIAALTSQVGALAKLVEQQSQIITAIADKKENHKKVVEPEIITNPSGGENVGYIAHCEHGKGFIAK